MKQGSVCSLPKLNLLCSHAFVVHLSCASIPLYAFITTSNSLPSTQILTIPDGGSLNELNPVIGGAALAACEVWVGKGGNVDVEKGGGKAYALPPHPRLLQTHHYRAELFPCSPSRLIPPFSSFALFAQIHIPFHPFPFPFRFPSLPSERCVSLSVLVNAPLSNAVSSRSPATPPPLLPSVAVGVVEGRE
jgi:hypothetical protein